MQLEGITEILEEREVTQPEEWRYEEILPSDALSADEVSEDDEDEAEDFEFAEQMVDI